MGVSGGWRGMAILVVAVLLASCSEIDFGGTDRTGPVTSEVADREPAASAPQASNEAGNAAGSGAANTSEQPSIWTRADDAPLRPDQPTSRFRDVVEPGPAGVWTMVGAIADLGAERSIPVVWETDSPDRSNPWTRTDVETGQDIDAEIVAVARTESMDVAVGSRGRYEAERPAVWLRRSGQEWAAVDPARFAGYGQGWLDDVTVDADGTAILALGTMIGDDAERVATIWSSPDGTAWTVVGDLPFSEDGSDDPQGMGTGPTGSVVTGLTVSDLKRTASAWWSGDGSTWNESLVETPDDADQAFLGEVVWFEDRFISIGGVGFEGVFEPATWSSPDGAEWRLESRDFGLDNERTTTAGFGGHSLRVAGDRLLATANEPFVQHIWSSTDGRSWTSVDRISRFRTSGVAVNALAGDGDIIVLATSEPSVILHRETWRETVISPAVAPMSGSRPFVNAVVGTDDGFVAVGGATIRTSQGVPAEKALSWHSEDGVTWTESGRFPLASLGPMHAVAGDGGRLVAVGAETIKSSVDRGVPGRAMIWEDTADGWIESTDTALSSGEARLSLNAVALAGEDVVAGGWIYGGNDIDALLIDSGAAAPQERVDVSHSGADNAEITAICGRSDGGAAAWVVTRRRSGGIDVSPLVRAPDGTWTDATLVQDADSAQDEGVNDCAHGPDGYVAVGWTIGSDGDEDARMWHSVDGDDWEPMVGPPGFSGHGNQWLDSMAATEDGYLLAGVDTSGGQVRPVVWYGSGEAWDAVPVGDGDRSLRNLTVAVHQGTVVVTGSWSGVVEVHLTTVDALQTRLAEQQEN